LSLQDRTKLNLLLQAVPRNGIATTARLQDLRISPQLARKYVQNGWLRRLGVGAFARAGESPDWLGGIHALQSQLGLTVHDWTVTVLHRCLGLFSSLPDDGTTQFDCGGFSVRISPPERAILEELHLVQSNSALEHALLLMEGLSTLRPSALQQLLVRCTSVKAKRLLLWAGERCQHSWMARLDVTKVDLGTGKRQVFKGGVLDPKYLITVPKPEELPSV
jgi:hypothetical protein